MKLFFNLFIAFSFLICMSCTKNNSGTKKVATVQDTISISTKKIVSSIGQILIPKAKKLVAQWTDYQELDALITRFYAVSVSDAFYNADDLVLLTKTIKDSIPIQKLKRDAMKMRFNVLNNEALRLKEMSKITNVSKNEVTLQVRRIIAAYSATNSKINDLISVSNLEEQMKDFDSAMLEAFSKEKEQKTKKKKKKKFIFPKREIPLSKRKKSLSTKKFKKSIDVNK